MSAVPKTTTVGIVAKSHLREATPHLSDIEAWLTARGRLGLERRPKLTVNCRNYLEFVGMLAALFGVDEK